MQNTKIGKPYNILFKVTLLKRFNAAGAQTDFSLVRFRLSASITKRIRGALTVNYTGRLQYKGCHLNFT